MSELNGDYECSECGYVEHNPKSVVCPECLKEERYGEMCYMMTTEDELRATIAKRDAEIERLRGDLQDILDLARTGLPPSYMTEESWLREKSTSIAHKADCALNRQSA